MSRRGKIVPPKSALLVEDSADVRDIIREILITENYSVKSASDGLSAWEIVNSERFDLIISDLGLPGMSGEELLRNMRKRSIDTPVILTAGIDIGQDSLDRKQLSNFTILNKPFRVEEIKKLISGLIREK